MNLAATSLPLTTDISTSVYSRSSPQTDLLQLDKAGLHSVTSLLFIDSAVKDYQSLVAEVRPETEVHVLDSSQDAIRQITQVLLGREGISSLHIVSHGESGKLGFGSSQLNSTDLPEYTQSLRSWGKSLTDDADILLYGCDIAQGEIGQSFIQQFAQLTGADIAASDDLTGSAALGGNWTLEVNTGDIAASLVFQASAIANYQYILPVDLISISDPNIPNVTASGYQSSGNISDDGRYVAFSSTAGNLAANDTNDTTDVFVRDLQTGTMVLVSANSSGTASGNGSSFGGEISGNGRYVAFISGAGNLVANDTNNLSDVFLRDLVTNTTTLISVNSSGTGSANGYTGSDTLRISSDGRYITFTSSASDLVANDTNSGSDVFRRDVVEGTTKLVSGSSTGTGSGSSASSLPSMTKDGRYVTFTSTASNLVTNDTNGTLQDVFRWDSVTGITTLVSANSSNTGSGNADSGSLQIRISNDGRYVAFTSTASNLVANDTNGSLEDVFVRDVQTGITTLVSVNSTGTGSGNGASASPPNLSSDGRYVSFISKASNLVANDSNGNIQDVFVRDVQTGITTLVSINSAGTGSGNGFSGNESYNGNFVRLSSDGRYVAFGSSASNLVSNDTNYSDDIFVRDLTTGITTLASHTSNGNSGNYASSSASFFSNNGRLVFLSNASNLIANDGNGTVDVFVYDAPTDTVTLVSQRGTGLPSSVSGGDTSITSPNSMSADGRYVVFTSAADNLVLGDNNSAWDVFLRDRPTGITTRVSRTSTGSSGNGSSSQPSISSDGRYVVYISNANNLVAGDNNSVGDVFSYDRVTGTTALVSHTVTGNSGDSGSGDAVISSDGRFIAFVSTATNLVANDSNNASDVFVWNRQTGEITLVSHTSTGSTGNNNCYRPTISSDGRYVAFSSTASNLVAGDGNSMGDVFVWDRQTNNITLVSHTSTGSSGGSNSYNSVISGDGNYVTFLSDASNLVVGDSNSATDIFLWERQTGAVTLVSRTSAGNSSNSYSTTPVISNDGRHVAFVSKASNLTANDVNYTSDVYVYDRQTSVVKLVSHTNTGSSGDSYATDPVISADGRFVAFSSGASDLAASDSNYTSDVFVWDRQTDRVNLVSRTSTGNSGNSSSVNPVLSSDGSYLIFASYASNLVAGDSNTLSDVFGVQLSGAPTIVLPGSALPYVENNPATALDSGATVVDSDSPNFNTGNLTISFAANGTVDDRLALLNQGTGTGQVGVSGSNVTYGGTIIGSLTGGIGTTPLVVTFNASANAAVVQAVLRNLTFANVSDGPSTMPRTVSIVLTDNTGIASNTVTKIVNVTAVNDAPPTVKNDSYSTDEETVLTISAALGVLSNDTDIDNDPMTATVVIGPSSGTLSFNPNGSFRYTPNLNFNGTDTFTYQVSDGTANSAIASVAITVTPVNDAPTWTGNATLAAVTQNTTNPSGSSLSSLFGSLFNDIDANASLSGLAIVGNPSTSTQGQWQYSINGTTWTNVGTVAEGATALALSADTLIRFVPAIGYSGTPPGLTVRALDNTYGSRGFTTGTTRVTVNTTNNGSTTAISGGTPATLNTSVTKSLPNLLWRNSGSGENAVWQLNSFALQSSYYLPAVDPSWQIASSTADFNHDGIADILWRNQVTGQNAIWEMNSTGLQSGSFITQVADLNWQIAGTGDFDGDKKSDILWRNRVSGQNAIWQMNGVALKSGDFITQVADLNWQIVGIGDFNGDGKSDLVWRNRASGQNAIWQMNGATLKSGDFITQVADTNWQIVGIGDFNGDGKSDLVWRNRASGQNAIWQMDGATLQSGIFITSLADTNWEISGVADLGSDSTPEIVWRNKQAGKAMIWQLSSFSDAQTYKLVDVIDPKWSVKPFAADLETAVSSG